MLSRALSLATLLLLAGWLAAEQAAAQENLDAGKSPSQLFAGTCNACHRSPRGLLRSVPASSLSSFLRQHYTTSPAMAGVLATYLISNGATDTRLGGASPKQGAKSSKSSARPDEGQLPTQAAIDHGPEGRKLSAKPGLSKRGRPGAEEPPKAEETPSGEMPREATGESKPEGTTPTGEGASQSAKVEEPGEAPATRVDPVPPVTPAPSAAPATAAPVSSVVSAASSERPAVPLPSKPTPPPPAMTATAPALPPVPPAGPPEPPISQ